MNNAYLLIGGNLGDRLANIHEAIRRIDTSCGKISNKSCIYETVAWGPIAQNDFLNQVLLLETNLNPSELIETLLNVEKEMGRERNISMGPRTIDIDILYYNNEIIDLPQLKIPHPRIQDRRFVLVPLVELAPEMKHPILQLTHNELLTQCSDKLPVHKKHPF
jgi:2-amino-4-hydroxy-6-hydroxymethyldihydropteridine diphosphokinase